VKKVLMRRVALGGSPGHPGQPQATRSTHPRHRVRELAREAERLGLDGVALDLFFAVARIEATGRMGAVRAELADTATTFAGTEARFYRRAARSLATERGKGLVPPRRMILMARSATHTVDRVRGRALAGRPFRRLRSPPVRAFAR
jgi:hypothetical protein